MAILPSVSETLKPARCECLLRLASTEPSSWRNSYPSSSCDGIILSIERVVRPWTTDHPVRNCFEQAHRSRENQNLAGFRHKPDPMNVYILCPFVTAIQPASRSRSRRGFRSSTRTRIAMFTFHLPHRSRFTSF